MSSLIFLLKRSIINSFPELLRKPAKLVLWGIVIAMIVGFFILSIFTSQSGDGHLDIIWLKGIIFLLILLFVAFAIQKGLSNGDAIFDMSDVNLLEIARLAAEGITNAEIGKRLYISTNTVKMTLKSIYAKLSINSRSLLKQHLYDLAP